MLISNNFYLPSNFTSMACSSLSNISSSSFFHYNGHFATRKKVHQIRHSYHKIKSSKNHGKVTKNSRKLGKFLQYIVNSILVFSTISNLDSCKKKQNWIHKFTPFKIDYFQRKLTSQKHLKSWDNSPKIQGKSGEKNQR